ncbi:MAG: hypothetical protein ACPGVK_01785 [Halocynthiibacter sp.]
MTANATLPVISSFWHGSDLSWLETLCIKSFLDNGHRFVLYTAEDLRGIPHGTEIRHPSEVLWPPAFNIADNDRHRVAVFSDIFRLHLIQKMGFIWVDLDAYCVRPFDFESPYVFAPSQQETYPTGVLGLPQSSKTLKMMLDFVMAPNPSQPWRGARLQRINQQRTDNGETWGIEALPWGCSGPKAFGHFLKQTNEDIHASHIDSFYPLKTEHLWKLHAPHLPAPEIETDHVYSVHIYGHQKKIIAHALSGLPAAGSYLEYLCNRHAVDPHAQKVPILPWMREKNTT